MRHLKIRFIPPDGAAMYKSILAQMFALVSTSISFRKKDFHKNFEDEIWSEIFPKTEEFKYEFFLF